MYGDQPKLYDLNLAGIPPLAWVTSDLDATAASAPKILDFGALRAWNSGDGPPMAELRLDDRHRGDRSCDDLADRRHGPHQESRQGDLA